MVRETRYLIVRNLPENCTEETIIDHFQRYGKIQSVKLQAAKDNDTDNTATVAFNDIKSAAKAHHAKNSIGEVPLKTDYWEGSTGTPVLANTPVAGSSSSTSARSSTYSSANTPTSRLVSTFTWSKGNSEEDGSTSHDKVDISQTSSSTPSSGINTFGTASAALDKLSSTSFDLQRGRGRERIKQKKFGQKFEKAGSFGRHGTATSARSLEAARSQLEAAAAAVALSSSSTTSGSNSTAGNTSAMNPIIVSDSKDTNNRDLKESSRESASRSQPQSVASPSSRNSGVNRLNSQSRSVSHSRSRSRGSRSSSCRSRSSGTSQSTSPHRSHTSSTTRPQSMVGTSRLVNSEVKEAKKDENDGERRPLGICVSGFPIRSTDSSLRDGLYHEYKKQGKVTTVQICSDGDNRWAIVSFRKPEDASKALEASQGKTFFGVKIKVMPHEGVEVDDSDRSNDIDSLDEYHVKSTRTLFVGNLEKETTTQDLAEKFKQFGEIIDVDIKRQGASTAFAFVQYADISSVVSALRAMEGEHIGINKIKLGFGKSMPTCCVWMDCLPNDCNNRMLRGNMARYGEVTYCCVDRIHNKGLVYFTSYDDAQRCVSDIKMRPNFMKKKLQVDFASRECQTKFLDKMESTGQLRTNERPDESRVHKFRQQRSFDSFQEEGSPSAYNFNRTSSSSFTTRNGRSNSGSTSYRRSRTYGDSTTFLEENHSSSRRSRRPEEFSQSGQFYSGKGSSDDYDAVLREYGHSQRERRERDLSPRPSVDRRVDGQSRQSSLDRYDKDRTIDIYNSRDTSPGSDHNSYHSDSRYRSSRDEKYREHYDDSKGDDNDHHVRASRNTSPHIHNHSRSLSHDSDYEHRGGSRSQSPPTPIQEDSSLHRIYYSDDFKRSVDIGDDYTYSGNQKHKDSDDLSSKTKLSIHSSKLGAEVIKTAGKCRKRAHDESILSDLSKNDAKLLRRTEKLSSIFEKSKVVSEKERKLTYESSRQIGKERDRVGSPGSSPSHGDSENGSVSEGDLHHLHQEKHHILRKLRELNEEGVSISEPDSPRSVAKVKSVAVKEALRLSGRKSDDILGKIDSHRRSGGKVRSIDSRRESRNHLSDDLNSTREDKSLVDEKDESFGGHSDSDSASDFRRTKKKRLDSSVDIVSVKEKSYRRRSSVDVSDDEDVFKIRSSSVVKRVSCDSRVGSKLFSETNKVVEVSSSDSGDIFKDGLSSQELSVIKQPRSVLKSNILFSNRTWNEHSPVGCFSPACSDEHTQDSVTSGSVTDRSSKHLSSPWQHSPLASPTGKDHSDGDYNYYKDFPITGSTSPDDSLSDDSMGGELLQTQPGEPSVEERIRAIDEMLNMTTSNKSSDPSLLISVLSNKDITNNNDSSALYSKFKIRKREGVLDGGNGSLLTERKPEPSVIMQQLLSKKSILDQDFKRLEQMTEIYDLSSSKDISTLLKSELVSPKLVDLKDVYTKSPLSPLLLSSCSSLLSSSSALPVTTSSSMLQPTVTTSVAGCVSSFASLSASVLTTSIVSAPVTTCSIHTSSRSTAVDNSNRSKIKLSEVFEDVSDRHTVGTNSLTLKQDVVIVSSSSVSSLSIPVFSNNSSLSSSSSLPLTSSLLSPSLSMPLVGHVQAESTTSVSQQSCKFFTSSSSSSVSVLSPSVSTTFSTSVHPTVHSKPNLQQSVLISSYTSCLSSPPLSATQSTSGAHVAAPFTQGPDKLQLIPTVGQEAPRLCSPSFTPENSRTSMSPHLPGSRSPRGATSHNVSDQQKTSETDLKVSVFSDADSKTDELKTNSVSPDIESPISVQSETSSIASVPLSSIDGKVNPHIEDKTLGLSSIMTPYSTNSLIHNTGVHMFVKNSDSSKTETLLSELGTDKSLFDIIGKGKDGTNKRCNKTVEAAETLVSRKSTDVFPTGLTQTVLTVSSKDNPDKGLSYVADLSKGQSASCSSVHITSDSDISQVLKVVTSSSSAAATPSTSMSTASTSKPSLDKNEKKSSSKVNSSYSKMATGSVKSEPLFAPDVKMEQTVKSNDSKSDVRHQSAKGTSNKSNSSDKKSTKLTSKDSQEHKDLPTSKDMDKKSESDHKNSAVQDTSKKEANKMKEKRDQSKDSEKTKAKDKEDAKKRGERKVTEKKVEKKVATKEEKKGDKKDEKKDRSSDRSKDSTKQNQVKHSKLDTSGSKQDKKQKEKAKVGNSKDKEKSSDKKVFGSLSCVSKLVTTPESKSGAKSDKDSKTVKNEFTVKDSASKDSTSKDSTVKDSISKDTATAKDIPTSKEAVAMKDTAAKDSVAKSEKECTQKADTVRNDQKTKHKSDAKSTSKVAEESKSESQASVKKSSDVSKPKKELENEETKQSTGKSIDKLQKLKQKEEEKMKEKRKLKEEKERQKEKDEKEKDDKERQKEKDKEEREKREQEEQERKEKEEKERLKEKERDEKERQKEKEREEKERQKEKEREEKERQKEKEREEKERQKKEREEKERQKEREREEKERLKEKEKEERERQKEKEREERERLKKEKEERERQKEKEKEEKERQKEKEREERDRKEKERKEREKEERERMKEKEREEKERQKEREKEEKEREEKERREKEEKERLKEKEREEREKQKEKEREEKERQKEKDREEKERKEKEEKERIKKEKAEREKQKQKERDERESQKEKEKLEKKLKEKEEKQKEKEKKEKEKKEQKPEKKEKGKSGKDGKVKKDNKDDKGKKDKNDKMKPDKDDKDNKSNKNKEKVEKEDSTKKPPPKKPKRNELAALLEHNDMIQMSFTSMYDRVKTQRNREPELPHKAEPAPKSSFDKFKQNRKKSGSKIKSSLYSFDTSSGGSDDDIFSDLSEPEPASKPEPVKETKPKKTKQIKRPHVSSTSSSSGDDDDDALLRASKQKDKKTDKFNEIFSSDSDDDNFQPPSSKLKASAKMKAKPAPKRRKKRDDSSDSMASSRDDLTKHRALSSITDSLDDLDMSEEEEDIKSKCKKTKAKKSKSIDHEDRDSSIESVTKKPLKHDLDSSVESIQKKIQKMDKKDSPTKKAKSDSKKVTKTNEPKTVKEESKPTVSSKSKVKGDKENSETSSKSEEKKLKSKVDSDKSVVKSKSKVDSEKPKSKSEASSKIDSEKSKVESGTVGNAEKQKYKDDEKIRFKEEDKHRQADDKYKFSDDDKHKHTDDKIKVKSEEKLKAKDEDKAKSRDDDKHKSKSETSSRFEQEKTAKAKIEFGNRSESEKGKSESKADIDRHLAKLDGKMDTEKSGVKTEPGSKSEKGKVSTDVESKSDVLKIEPDSKQEDKTKVKDKLSNDGKSKSLGERKKKNESNQESSVKKKKKKKYDPLIEEELVNSLITKVYDKVERDKKVKKKTKMNMFDSEAEDTLQSDTSSGILSGHDDKVLVKDLDDIVSNKFKENKMDCNEMKSDKHADIKPAEKHVDIKPSDKSIEKHLDIKPTEKQADVKQADKQAVKLSEKQADMRLSTEDVTKKKHKKKKEKKEESDAQTKKTKKKIQADIKGKKHSDLKEEKLSTKHEDLSEDEHLKPPKKKKKKKEHGREVDKEKDKPSKSGKSPQKKTDVEKSHTSGDEKDSSNVSDDKNSSQIVDEFTSFWGHPKPILIPKRLKDSKKSVDEKSKHNDESKTESSDKCEAADKVKEEPICGKEEKSLSGDDVSLDVSPDMGKAPDSISTPKVENDIIDDFVVPISEAETTVITEVASIGCESVSSNGDSLVIETVSADDIAVIPDETMVCSSVENDDDDFPSLIIDEIPEKIEKKTPRKDKKLLKKQQEKVMSDHLDEVIASVAMALSSDDDDDDRTGLVIETSRADKEVLLSDIINQEVRYGNKSSSERKSIFSDKLALEKDRKEKASTLTSPIGGSQKDRDSKVISTPKEYDKKKDAHKVFGLIDEETKKRDEELLKTLAVLCDPNVDKPVVIEDVKREPTEKEIRQKEEAERKKAEEERIKAEEEEKSRKEKEEQALKEASDEAARAVESLLEFHGGGYDQDSMDMDDDFSPLLIEPADKEPPVESSPLSPMDSKSDTVSSIFSSPIPDKVTANLDDKLLESNLDRKGPNDQPDSTKIDPFNLFATPVQTVASLPVFTPPRSSVTTIREKTPEPPITLMSPQRQFPQSPQMHSPHRLQFQPRPLHSPQHQAQSPQRPLMSPHDLQSPQPLLQSPQRPPFINKDTKMDNTFMVTTVDVPSVHPDIDVPKGQPPRRVSVGLPSQAIHDQSHRPMQVSCPRKSQEFPPELLILSRPNTSVPEEASSVTHLDRRFPPLVGSDMILSKERIQHINSSLPPPVSISLDNAPHESNSQSPLQNLSMPPHQESILLSPKKISPILQFKERTPDQSLTAPSKTTLQESLPHFSKGPILDQMLTQYAKGPSQEQIFCTNKGPAPEFFKGNKVDPQILFPPKGMPVEKPSPVVKIPDQVLVQHKNPVQELVQQHTKGPPHVLDHIPQHDKGLLLREPLFSPKAQSDNPFNYADQNIDFLLNSPPRNNTGFPNFPDVNMTKAAKQPDYSQDPLFVSVSEVNARPADKELPAHPRRNEGFPASYYQEPLSGPKPHQDTVTVSLQQNFEDDKKGTRKRKRGNKKPTNEDRAAALAELQAIEESVQANVDSIHKALNANQAKAAAEKANMVGSDKKKTLDAYDFEAHIVQDMGGNISILSSETPYPNYGETDAKPLRTRNERGRGRGYGTRRGRRGRGSIPSVHDLLDGLERSEAPNNPPPHFQNRLPSQDHLQSHIQQHFHRHSFPAPPQQQTFQRQTSQPNQGSRPLPHFYQQPHQSPLSPENSSSLSALEWQQKQQVPHHYQHNQMQNQPPQAMLQPPQSKLSLVSKSDVLSPESNRQDLDLSYGESELIINLDDQPSSTEGKENQYNLSSDGEDRGLAPSPSTPKSQRSTRARKQPDYKAIASGNIHTPGQPRPSRSGGSPRGVGNGAQSPKNMSPRTRSSENMSSSPVVKLEKLEVGRTTRSRRDGKGCGKDSTNEALTPNSSFDEQKINKPVSEESRSVSKENVYEFVDNEHDQMVETTLRSVRARKKRASDNQEFLQAQQPMSDYMPASPPTPSTSTPQFVQEPRLSFDAQIAEGKPPEDSIKMVPLSNVDAIIEAVSKGNFGEIIEEVNKSVELPVSAVVSDTESAPGPPPTRSSRRSTELKKEAELKDKAEKTFVIAEPPKFEGKEGSRKGPTVPPLRIKVAHGTKVEKNEEKHYVIERSKEHDNPPLAFTVKITDGGNATIKPASATGNTTPNLPVVTAGAKNVVCELFKSDALQKKDSNLGLFSGLPQNEQQNIEQDINKFSVSNPQTQSPWKTLEAATDESSVSRPLGAMHPKVAAKVQASQESQNNTSQVQTSIPQTLQQYPPSSTVSSIPSLSKSSPVTPATPHGLKHAWCSGLKPDTPHQSTPSEQIPQSNSYLPTYNSNQNVSQMAPSMPRDPHQPPAPQSVHQESKQPPNAHSQPILHPDRTGKPNKPVVMDMNADRTPKLSTETQKHHQVPFGFQPHVPPAHSGQRAFIIPSDQPGGMHGPHYQTSSLLKSTQDNRPSKSPSIQSQLASKIGPEVRTQTPPVTSAAMLYAGVVPSQPHSLSPTSASPEGQVIERIQNPIRQLPESSQTQATISLHLPGSHHQDSSSRFMKDDGQDGPASMAGHGERTPAQEMAMFQHIIEKHRLQRHLMMAEVARTAAAHEAARNSAPDPSRNIAANIAMRNALESSRNTPVTLEGGRKGPLPQSQPVGHGQPLNLTPQSDNRSGQTDSSRVTPKSTPPAPQSPFSLTYFERKGEAGRLPTTVPGSFMQPSPGGHCDGLAPHLYPELSLANLSAHSPYMVGRLPIDPRIYGAGQQAPPHLMRDGVLPGSFSQGFPPGARFPGMDHADGKKVDPSHPEQSAPHMLRSPSPIQRQLQADALRQQLSRMPCDLPTRDSPVGFLQRYPVMWQGALALKNDNSYVQMHFIAGNRRLPNQALPQPMQNGALPPLRISQRMRLEHAQLEGVAKRMQCEDHYCILIAVACGRDQLDINQQTRALKEGFITYLLSKQAAGIVNVPLPGSEQVRFVVHIFPPCEFVDNSVAQQGSVVLMEQLREVPHAVVIIATT